jgi:hypothetical protein
MQRLSGRAGSQARELAALQRQLEDGTQRMAQQMNALEKEREKAFGAHHQHQFRSPASSG